jgi:hypothetical protein
MRAVAYVWLGGRWVGGRRWLGRRFVDVKQLVDSRGESPMVSLEREREVGKVVGNGWVADEWSPPSCFLCSDVTYVSWRRCYYDRAAW